MTDVHAALAWVVSALDRHHCPYQVVGGLAALAHGGRRPLNDIDLYAPLADFPGLVQDLGPYTVWGPAHYRDDAWDLVFMKIDFAGVRIEIGDASSSPQYFDAGRARWVDQGVDFSRSQRRTVQGVAADVMPLDELLRYKRALARPVDLVDVEELTRPGGHAAGAASR
jgi:hypothetical protein